MDGMEIALVSVRSIYFRIGSLQTVHCRLLGRNMKSIIKSGVIGLCLAAGLQVGTASAIPVTVSGATVSFTYDSALTGLFGSPTVVGDSFYFTPITFVAQSYNGAGIVHTSATFNVAVTANAGYALSATTLAEQGDYYAIGSGSEVAVGGKLFVRDLADPVASVTSSSITPDMPLADSTTLAGFATSNWTASAGGVLPSGWGPVVGTNVTIQNILLASSSLPGTAAFIEKKFVGLTVVTSPVPEPNNALLLLSSLGLVWYTARRKKPINWR
jgi:hypothetical protein